MHRILSFLTLSTFAAASNQIQQPLHDDAAVQPLASSDMPLLGFGTWNLKAENTSDAVSWAIQTGYRHIDCAVAYGNQVEVGAGIADGLAKTGLSRDDLWITSKLWNDQHGSQQNVEDAIDHTLEELGIDYLDLWHMHWPISDGIFSKSIEYIDTWKWMEHVANSGRVHHLGVSNFSPEQLADLINHASVKPQVHQMELHPYLQQKSWLETHEKLGIHVTAYSPLAGTNPTYDKGDPPHLLKNRIVQKIAIRRKCTAAQVVLKWGLIRGTSVIPKSIHKDYISENFLALECPLRQSDVNRLDELGDYHHRFNNPSKSWVSEVLLQDS
ncbi:hypothetical protein MRB53_041589 [Persea americana]|nr:hypothetical protein MRB53_041589 [Persea americana]